MASIQKTAKGYRAQVYVSGVRDSGTFRTRREADAWASARETELREAGTTPAGQRHTVAEMLARYRDEVSPKKRGERWEVVRINRFLGDEAFPVAAKVGDVTPDMLGAWRNAKLRTLKPGSVIRDMGLLSSIFETARREWRWVESNPLADVSRPPAPHHRETVIGRWQIKAMLRSLGYVPHQRVQEVRNAVAVCFVVALRTGMRAGELCGLTWDRVRDDHCILPVTKTKPRHVPLPPKARAAIERMRGWDETYVFGIEPATLDAMFRKYRKRAGLEGFTFHDSRHTAATWMARKIDVLSLCKAFGWSDPKRAMIYYNPTASQIAKLLR